VDVPFRVGTAPTLQAASRTEQQLEQMDRTGREF
jgi:hypothetical protein